MDAPLYRVLIGAAFVLLGAAAIEWHRVRPREVPILRVYALAGTLLALVFQVRALVFVDGSPDYSTAANVGAVEHAAILVFEAAVFAAASLLTEVRLSRRRDPRIARADLM